MWRRTVLMSVCCVVEISTEVSIFDIDWLENGHRSDISVLSIQWVVLTRMNKHMHIFATILLLLWHYYLQHQLYSRLVQIRHMNILIVRTLYCRRQKRSRRPQAILLHLCLGRDQRRELQFASLVAVFFNRRAVTGDLYMYPHFSAFLRAMK